MTCLVGIRRQPLTDREIEILRALATGKRGPAVAAELGITEPTLRSHLRRIHHRLEARTTTHAVAIAIRQGSLR